MKSFKIEVIKVIYSGFITKPSEELIGLSINQDNLPDTAKKIILQHIDHFQLRRLN